MVIKTEGVKGPILLSRYYYLEYFKIFLNSEDQDNEFDNPERKSRTINGLLYL